ncbi:MAG: response regulator [Thermoanaerobaculales bacterium]|jgi:CheY-like chemotaxis protein|nr:response regulator [Thermoanaerobaculales bacterium]
MSGTILLADDSLTIQKVVELTFADTDYRVVAVSSGDELIARLGDARPDLIICDVIMPGRDGYEICQQIKSSPSWLHLPVILLTGTFEPFDRDRAIAAGCSEIITKPFEARKLVDTVERLIGAADLPIPDPDSAAPRSASDDDLWPEEATPAEVPPPDRDFGTRIAATAQEDGIEFTTSGFAEMEAAGRSPRPPSAAEVRGDGLDFDPGPGGTAAGQAPAITAARPPVSPDPSAQTVRIDVSAYRDESPADTGEVFEAPVGGDAPGGGFRDEPSMADTSPVDAPAEDEGDADDGRTGTRALRLSDEDVDRIARRVVELAADRLDQIAWEVVPDMAEIVVRQRIRELEAESEAGAPQPVQ